MGTREKSESRLSELGAESESWRRFAGAVGALLRDA